jgi:hypothetical protein
MAKAPISLVTVIDSVSCIAPAGTKYVLAYVDGKLTGGNFARWGYVLPSAWRIQITTTGARGFAGADVEAGDLSVSEMAAWSAEELEEGRRPFLYGSASTRALLVPELATKGITLGLAGEVDYFLANPDGVRTIEPGDVAKQYLWGPPEGPQSFDTSVALSSWAALRKGDRP